MLWSGYYFFYFINEKVKKIDCSVIWVFRVLLRFLNYEGLNLFFLSYEFFNLNIYNYCVFV